MANKKLDKVIAKLEVFYNEKRDEKKSGKHTILDLLIATKL